MRCKNCNSELVVKIADGNDVNVWRCFQCTHIFVLCPICNGIMRDDATTQYREMKCVDCGHVTYLLSGVVV